MTKKRKPKRDYKAEYARRIARAAEKGLPRTVARGHAPKGKAGIKLAKILGIKPGEAYESRPPAKRRQDGPSFEERLEAAGFGSWIIQQRRKVLLRDTLLSTKRADRIVTKEEDFVTVLMETGHSEKEAYTQWFSPK